MGEHVKHEGECSCREEHEKHIRQVLCIQVKDSCGDFLRKMPVVGDGNDSHIALFGFFQDHIPDLSLCDYIQHSADLITDQVIHAA